MPRHVPLGPPFLSVYPLALLPSNLYSSGFTSHALQRALPLTAFSRTLIRCLPFASQITCRSVVDELLGVGARNASRLPRKISVICPPGAQPGCLVRVELEGLGVRTIGVVVPEGVSEGESFEVPVTLEQVPSLFILPSTHHAFNLRTSTHTPSLLPRRAPHSVPLRRQLERRRCCSLGRFFVDNDHTR